MSQLGNDISDYSQTKIDDRGLNMDYDGLKQRWMPNELMMRRFEETNIDTPDDLYYEYARQTLTDRGPDSLFLASEEPRRNTSDMGILNVRYYGHRGEEEDARHPEIMRDFIGPDWRDPRATTDLPDFRKYREQLESRNRLFHFDNDAGNENQITGLQRSQFQEMQDNQTVNKIFKDRTKIFTTQRETLVNGKKFWNGSNANNADSCLLTQYNWEKSDDSLNINLKSNFRKEFKITPDILNEAKDYDIVDYSTNNVRKTSNKLNKNNMQTETVQDQQLANSDTTALYKNLSVVMRQITQDKTTHDTDWTDNRNTIHTLRSVLYNITKAQNNTIDTRDIKEELAPDARKINTRQNKLNLANSVQDAVSPELQQTATAIYRKVHNRPDVSKHSTMSAISTTDRGESVDNINKRNKSANRQRTDAIRKKTDVAVEEMDLPIHSYKTNKNRGLRRLEGVEGAEVAQSYVENFKKSKHTARGKTPIDDTSATIDMPDNTQFDRAPTPLGDIKSARRKTESSLELGEMMENSNGKRGASPYS